MNTYALPALKEKRAKLAGEILHLKKRIKASESQLIALDATITIFDPNFDSNSIKPINPRQRVNLFRMGEMGRMIIDALRKADGKPLSTPQVAEYILGVSGFDGQEARETIRKTTGTNLNYLARRGKVIRATHMQRTSWTLPSD